MHSLSLLHAIAAAAALAAPPPIEYTLNASNANSLQERRVMTSGIDSPFLKVLGNASDLPACAALCVAYIGAARCTGFTRALVSLNATAGNCYGNVDGAWLPLPSPGNDNPRGPHLFDCGRIQWPCQTDSDCSLNGICGAEGNCTCVTGWTGPRCGQLDLLPVDRAVLGFNPIEGGKNMSSWGGSVWAVNGSWHMYASRLDNHCGISSYLLNSRVVHAVSDSPLGPFLEADSVVDAFAHEPAAAIAPDGRLALITVHGPLNGFAECVCVDGSTSHNCNGCNNSCHPAQPVLSIAKSPYGPWTSVQIPPPVGPNSTQGHEENPSIWINGKGELWGMSRGGGVSAYASVWDDFSTWTRPTNSSLGGSPDVEDPIMWQDENQNFHALTHLLEGPHFCDGYLCFVGVHQFSRDGFTWSFGGVAYTNNVSFTDGTSILLTRRERPHVVFKEGTQTIIALSNSAMVGGGYGDRSFTLVQGVRGM